MKLSNFGVLQKESAMASKPGVVTRATVGATGSGPVAEGSAPTGTAGKVTAKTKTEVARLRMLKVKAAFGLFVHDMTLLTHQALYSSRGSACFSFTPLLCQTFLTYLTGHRWVLPQAEAGFSPKADYLSNSPAPWSVD